MIIVLVTCSFVDIKKCGKLYEIYQLKQILTKWSLVKGKSSTSYAFFSTKIFEPELQESHEIENKKTQVAPIAKIAKTDKFNRETKKSTIPKQASEANTNTNRSKSE